MIVSYCDKAIAYIKEYLPKECDSQVIKLSEKDSLVCQDLGNGFLVTYLVDEGDHFSYIQNRHLFDERMSIEELHSFALRNLSDLALGTVRINPYKNIYALFLDGNFEASLLMLDELWDLHLAEYAPNGFVVAAPCRDVIAFCDINSKEGISELKQLIGRVFDNADHQLSDCLYRRQNDKWVRLLNA